MIWVLLGCYKQINKGLNDLILSTKHCNPIYSEVIINMVKGGVSSGTVGGEQCLEGGGGAAVGQPAALRHPHHPEH